MKEKYISVNRAVVVLKEKCEQGLIDFATADSIAGFIDKQPTADVAEVRHGKWLLEREPNGKPYCFHCSLCDDDFHNISHKSMTKFCPDCGAKMDGE